MTIALNIRVLPVGVLALVAGAFLMGLSVPATIDAFIMIPANAILEKLQLHEPVSNKELSRLLSSKKRSLNWGETGRKWTDLAAAQLILADQTNDDEETRELVGEALRSLKIGLALAPANAFAWARLALADYQAAGPSRAVASALRMSLLTAHYTPRLLFVRLQLCFAVWPHFAVEDRSLVFQQVRLAWKDDPKRLVMLARELNQIEMVRTALSSLSDEEGAKFKVLIRQLSS